MGTEERRIKGDNGDRLEFVTTVVLDHRDVQELLRRLTCTALMPREILESTIGTNDLLRVALLRQGFACGEDAHFTAERNRPE